MALFFAFLFGGIFGIGRLRKGLLGDGAANASDENPSWLQAVIAEHQRASGTAPGADASN